MKMYKIIPILVCALFFSGCVGLQNIPDYIAGTYVNQPAEGTAGRYSKNFDLPYPVLFEKTEKALKDMGVSIRYKNEKKRTIMAWYFDDIYDNCIDTTKVSVFFKEIEQDKTKVDVACGNYGLAKFASSRLFKSLEAK